MQHVVHMLECKVSKVLAETNHCLLLISMTRIKLPTSLEGLAINVAIVHAMPGMQHVVYMLE